MTTEAMGILAGLVLESGARWGTVAEPWQWTDAEAVLDLTPGAARNHFQTRPRGGSKTTDLGGTVIAALLEQLPAGSRGYAVAADRDQGRLLIDSVAGFVERTPGLRGALTVDSFKVTATRSAASVEVLAADSASAYGLRPSILIADEIGQWRSGREPQEMWRALISALGKVPDARLAVLTSAGDPAHWSFKILEHARTSDRWRVSEVPGPLPWTDPAYLAEQQALLPAWAFNRLHLNQWTAADDRLTSLDDLRACVTLDGPLQAMHGVDYVMALDVGLVNDRTVGVVCHLEQLAGGQLRNVGLAPSGEQAAMAEAMVRLGKWSQLQYREFVGDRRPSTEARPIKLVLDRMVVWSGSHGRPVSMGEIEQWCIDAHRSFNRCRLIVDPWQTKGMSQRLVERGIKVDEFLFSSGSVGRLARTLHMLLRDHALALPDDEELLNELANVRLRETAPGVVRMDHDSGRHDDRAIALAMAAVSLLERPPAPPMAVVHNRDGMSSALKGTR